MKIKYEDVEYDLHYNVDNRVFALYDEDGEMFDRLDPAGHMPKTEPNQAWVDEMYLSLLKANDIVTPVIREGAHVVETGGDDSLGYLVDVIHPDFNDGGYGSFGDFARVQLGQQSQYASRYIDGRIEGYPNLGEGLRFNNGFRYGKTYELDARDYHSVRIHRDDMEEFKRRYQAHREERLR